MQGCCLTAKRVTPASTVNKPPIPASLAGGLFPRGTTVAGSIARPPMGAEPAAVLTPGKVRWHG